jgi:hypothetical protein
MGDLPGHPFRGNQYAGAGSVPPGAPDMSHLKRENKIPAKIKGVTPEYQKKSGVREVFDAASSIFDDLASAVEGL